MIVASRMHVPVITIGPTETLAYAQLLMANRGIRHLPVVEGERLVGVLSNRDIRGTVPPPAVPEEARRYLEQLMATPVSAVMTREVETVGPTTPIEQCATIMARKKIGCLPVVAVNRLEGIITTTDVLGMLAEMLGISAPGSRLEVEVAVGKGAISQVTRLIEGHGVRITSIASFDIPERSRLRLVMRLHTVNTEPVVKALQAAGYGVPRAEVFP
jgi:acetoin utilization protein AcuB